eukprot:8780840-Pyramimonas_sp.AAC.1
MFFDVRTFDIYSCGGFARSVDDAQFSAAPRSYKRCQKSEAINRIASVDDTRMTQTPSARSSSARPSREPAGAVGSSRQGYRSRRILLAADSGRLTPQLSARAGRECPNSVAREVRGLGEERTEGKDGRVGEAGSPAAAGGSTARRPCTAAAPIAGCRAPRPPNRNNNKHALVGGSNRSIVSNEEPAIQQYPLTPPLPELPFQVQRSSPNLSSGIQPAESTERNVTNDSNRIDRMPSAESNRLARSLPHSLGFRRTHLGVDVHLAAQLAQRPDQQLGVAVDAHPAAVDKDLGGGGDHAGRDLLQVLRVPLLQELQDRGRGDPTEMYAIRARFFTSPHA